MIEDHNSSRPLFLYVAYQAAHAPIVRPPDMYLDMYPAQVTPHSTYQDIMRRMSIIQSIQMKLLMLQARAMTDINKAATITVGSH